MDISASQIESIVRSVINSMGGSASSSAAGPLPKVAHVAMLTDKKKIEVKNGYSVENTKSIFFHELLHSIVVDKSLRSGFINSYIR